jgi:archaellum component FlaG (FlaF/FlaG flagellin family)
MKIKAIVLSAALGAVMANSASAQVYSANTVGYVNMSLSAGFHILANPLEGSPDNSLDSTLALSDVANIGAAIYRFDGATQNYLNGILWIGTGWFPQSGNPDDAVIAPGEGFFIGLNAPENITWVGEVLQGNLSNPIPAGGNLSLRSSQVPQAASLTALEFPAFNFDTVYLWNSVGQTYEDAWQYFDGLGWFNPSDPLNTDGPTIAVGTGFFVQKMDPADTSWDRVFSVNN